MKNTCIENGVSPFGGPIMPRGHALLNNPLLNKGTGFPYTERDAYGLRGLLPPRVFPMEAQIERAMLNFQRMKDPLDKYVFLTALQNRNEVLFYALMERHPEEMIPIIYTPTVGQACLEFGAIYRSPRGLFLSLRDRGHIREVLANWPNSDVRMICVTDGERILGLGDLGALGMGIPIGKLSLYTACAGLHPYYTLPVTLDLGTDNEKLRNDKFYIGVQEKRIRGREYDSFIEEFVAAVKERFPHVLLQWEDFGNANAFRLLNRYRKEICSFNDDIQGTASVALAGLLSSLRMSGGKLRDQKLLFLGAGEAGTGIGELFVQAAISEGMSAAEARAKCWYVDSQGLVVKGRPGKLAEHKEPFAHDHPFIGSLAEAVKVLKPTALIGVSGTPRTFTQEIIGEMARINARPIIFALSNPTSKAECTAEEAYVGSKGRAIFASGSPFDPVTYEGKTFVPGQGNNVYIFPGVGLGALVAESTEVTDAMFLRAARMLAQMTTSEDHAMGRIFPSLTRIRQVSLQIAVAVAEECYSSGLAKRARPANITEDIEKRMFKPSYQQYI